MRHDSNSRADATSRDSENVWLRYERERCEWLLLHHDATADEYQAAMVAIAERLGV